MPVRNGSLAPTACARSTWTGEWRWVPSTSAPLMAAAGPGQQRLGQGVASVDEVAGCCGAGVGERERGVTGGREHFDGHARRVRALDAGGEGAEAAAGAEREIEGGEDRARRRRPARRRPAPANAERGCCRCRPRAGAPRRRRPCPSAACGVLGRRRAADLPALDEIAAVDAEGQPIALGLGNQQVLPCPSSATPSGRSRPSWVARRAPSGPITVSRPLPAAPSGSRTASAPSSVTATRPSLSTVTAVGRTEPGVRRPRPGLRVEPLQTVVAGVGDPDGAVAADGDPAVRGSGRRDVVLGRRRRRRVHVAVLVNALHPVAAPSATCSPLRGSTATAVGRGNSRCDRRWSAGGSS